MGIYLLIKMFNKLLLASGFTALASAQQSFREHSPEEIKLFEEIKTMWDTVEDESENVPLNGTTSWEWPKWAEGLFATTGTSKHEMHGRKFNHLFDGYGRFSTVKFRDNQALFTSKFLKSQFWNRSVEADDVPAGLLFLETTPPRPASEILPVWNLLQPFDDNNWVDMELLADNKTFVGTTDDAIKVEIDGDTLETVGHVAFDNEFCITGITHSRQRPDGPVLSLCYELNVWHLRYDLVVYSLTGDNTKHRN